jgi:hypothetical protein
MRQEFVDARYSVRSANAPAHPHARKGIMPFQLNRLQQAHDGRGAFTSDFSKVLFWHHFRAAFFKSRACAGLDTVINQVTRRLALLSGFTQRYLRDLAFFS